MNSRVIYMQTGFWKQLRSNNSIAGTISFMNIYEVLLESELRTDISDEDFDADSYLVYLWKNHVSGRSHIELYESITIDEPEDDAEELSATYLTDTDSATCKDLGNRFGIVAINCVDLPQKAYLFKGDGFMLKKNSTRYNDRFLQFRDKISYPCNAMILIDPYILTKTEKTERNLRSLLEATLPNRKLQVIFQIAIFSMIGEKNTKAAEGEKIYNQIKDLITALRKGLKFDLTLYAISHSEDFHSRMIITNNVYFNAEDGFEVFKDDNTSNKNAKFDIVLPRLVGDNRKDMSNYLRWIAIAKNRSETQPEIHLWGERNNRLFDLIN